MGAVLVSATTAAVQVHAQAALTHLESFFHTYIAPRQRKLLISLCTTFVVFSILLLGHHNPAYTPRVSFGPKPSSTSGTSLAEAWLGEQFPPPGPIIPRNIWQIYVSRQADSNGAAMSRDRLNDVTSWIQKNPAHQFTILTDPAAAAFVAEYFSYDSDVLRVYRQLHNTGLKSDLLRYLLLYIKGGVYTDIDTVAHKPIRDWVPLEYKNVTRVMVGIEYDQREDSSIWGGIFHPVQFCQWTIVAAPGHPLFMNMTNHVIRSLRTASSQHNTSLPELSLSNDEVLKSSGPAGWTEIVFDHLQRADANFTDLRLLKNLQKPRLFGDILVMPINAFGMGQPHSGSKGMDGDKWPEDALLKHNFGGSWRHDGK